MTKKYETITTPTLEDMAWAMDNQHLGREGYRQGIEARLNPPPADDDKNGEDGEDSDDD